MDNLTLDGQDGASHQDGTPLQNGAPLQECDPLNLRDYLALALDCSDLKRAVQLASSLSDYFRVAKIGLELYSAAGAEAVSTIKGLGYEVFCDLKLHDIPNTVNRASRVIGTLGVSYLTMHASGGCDMLKAGVQGLCEGADSAGVQTVGGRAVGLAVTVLTSQPLVSATQAQVTTQAAPQASSNQASHRASSNQANVRAAQVQLIQNAVDAKCGGIVCSASDLVLSANLSDRLIRVVPGIRLPGDSYDDQQRVATPADALAAGADMLVIGRAVTSADDPILASERLHSHLVSL